MVFQKRKRRRRSRMNEFKSHHHHHHDHRSQLNCETRRWSSTSSSCWMPTYVRPSSHLSSSSLSVLPTECSSSAAPLVDKSLLPSTAISPPLHHHHQRCPRRHRRRIHVAHPLWLVFEDQHQHLVHMHFVYIHINRRHRLLRSIGHAVWVWETIWDLQSVDLYSPFSGMAANLYVVHVHINFRSDSVLVGKGETRTYRRRRVGEKTTRWLSK